MPSAAARTRWSDVSSIAGRRRPWTAPRSSASSSRSSPALELERANDPVELLDGIGQLDGERAVAYAGRAEAGRAREIDTTAARERLPGRQGAAESSDLESGAVGARFEVERIHAGTGAEKKIRSVELQLGIMGFRRAVEIEGGGDPARDHRLCDLTRLPAGTVVEAGEIQVLDLEPRLAGEERGGRRSLAAGREADAFAGSRAPGGVELHLRAEDVDRCPKPIIF